MDYQIALPPELNVSPAEFVAAWNATPQCRAVAEAHMAQPKSVQYDPALVAAGLAVLAGLASGVAGNALSDLLKELLFRQGVRRRTEIVQMDQPDGSRLLVVTIIEE
jgi:hypothetical protein